MILDAKFEVIQVELNDIKLDVSDQEIEAEFGQFQVVTDAPVYDGPYAVTPSTAERQTLPTAQKMMKEDVKVEKIPYAEVSNNSGGTTATIGNEV